MQGETAVKEERRSQERSEPPELRRWISPLAPVRLALWRLARSSRLLLAVGLGILVAVVLICTVPLYSSLVSNVQLQHQLSIQTPSNLNIEVDTTLAPVVSSEVGDVIEQNASLASQNIKRFAPTSTWHLRIDTNLPPTAINGKRLPNPDYPLPPNPALQAYVFNYQQALPHMNILAGRLPEATAANQMPEIMATSKLGVKPGDTISISDPHLTMKVVGVWFPKSLDDPYWNGNGLDFATLLPPCFSNCSPAIFPVLFNQNSFFATFGSTPTTTSPSSFAVSVHYVSFTLPGRITVATTPEIITAIAVYRSNLNGALYSIAGVTSIGVGTQLDTILSGEQQQFGLLAQPLYVIIAQVVGLTLLFVIAMATLLIEAQASDIATLKSRGASRSQLLLNYTLQGLIIATLAALAGPFIAVGLSLTIIRFFVPDAATTLGRQATSGNALAQIASPQMVLQPALAGALLGLAALILAAWFASRRDVLAFRRESGRQAQAPFWQRYYLDMGLVVLCAAGYLELGEFGGLNVRQQLGQSLNSTGSGTDPLQLLAPGLLLLAGALLALRLFPVATRAGAWLAKRARGATSLLTFAQLDRATAQFARLALLLTLAIGLGVFALTFQASIRGNAVSQARFLVGSDERVVLESPVDGTPPTAPLQAEIAAVPGVEDITPVYRTLATSSVDETNIDLLGIDPSTFAQVADWSSDYAQVPLTRLLSQMQGHIQGTAAGDQQHPIWALVDSDFAGAYQVTPGVVFTLLPQDSSGTPLFFVVGAVVAHFPTLGDSSVNGHVVFDLADYADALNGPRGGGGYIDYIGPNEYWLRTTGNAATTAERAKALANPNLWVQTAIQRTAVEQQEVDDPLAAGMTGLLVLGAGIAALLAVLGSVIQASVAARRRLTQFAILRTLGGQRRQLMGILLGQQLVVYGFGLVTGTLLGAILSTATLPFLQFSTSTVDTAEQQLPPYLLSINLVALAVFYLALLLAFGLALFTSMQVAMRGGLGQTLRIGED